MRLGRPLQVHEHDDDQIQDDDAPGVDEHLNRAEKRRAEQHVQLAATNRKSITRNSTLCTVSFVLITSTAKPRMNAASV